MQCDFRPLRAALFVTLISTAAFAPTPVRADTPAAAKDDDRKALALPTGGDKHARRGFYAGVSLGAGFNSDFVGANDDGSLSAIDADKQDMAWQLHVGWQFTDYFGVEAGYVDLGKVHFDAVSDGTGPSWSGPGVAITDLEADGWYGGVRGAMPVSDRWTLFASLSWFRWQSTETFVDNGFTSTDEDSGGDVRYGAGFECDIGEKDKWVLRGELARTEVDNDADAASTATIGMSRRF